MVAQQNEEAAVVSWFRGEFAAANAIIDELCEHLRVMDRGKGEYGAVFDAIRKRRVNWMPVLIMQNYFNVADVTSQLAKVAAARNLGYGEVLDSENTKTGSQETQPTAENIIICSNREDCEQRRSHIKANGPFVANESVKGHMVNVVKGLKLYENIFTDLELSKLNDFVNDLRVAGQNGELSGETYILYNQQTKGNKRELIQFGVPIFERIKEDATGQAQKGYIMPIPAVLQGVIEHLIHLGLIPEHKKPSSCIITFFDEGEYSQPFVRPPHLEQPFSTLLLSESRMAYGRTLSSDSEGNYKGSLMLSLKEGSLLLMRGNSSCTARHAICASQNKRVSITFFKVRTETIEGNGTTHANTLCLWQPGGGVVASPYAIPNIFQPMNVIPPFIVVHNPMIVCPQRDGTGVFLPGGTDGTGVFLPGGTDGTGVFLPGGTVVKPKNPTKQLPPRARRQRFFSLPSLTNGHKSETTSDSGSTTS